MLRMPTKEELIETVRLGKMMLRNYEDEYDWLSGEPSDNDEENWVIFASALKNIKVVEDRNFGDGNDAFKTFYFKDYDLYISMTGYYSSYNGYEWTSIFLSKPYQYTETRYEEI